MEEHLDDAEHERNESHMFKHWTIQHGGNKTKFSFKVISFFSSPLKRQVAEAVRILKTGAKRILNSKGMLNRCSLPRIIAQDAIEEVNLGDMGLTESVEVEPDQIVEETEGTTRRMSRREIRLEKMKDLDGSTKGES